MKKRICTACLAVMILLAGTAGALADSWTGSTQALETAAVISPIHKIQDRETGKEYVISKDGKPGPWSIKMREILMGIQYGELEDKYGWCTIVDC